MRRRQTGVILSAILGVVILVIVATISALITFKVTSTKKLDDNVKTESIEELPKSLHSKNQNVYQAVAKKATPSVVGIITETTSTDNPYNLPQSVSDSGTGFIVDKKGYILTNAHVVGNGKAKEVNVTYNDGKKTVGKVIYIDNALDLAIVKIKVDNLIPAELGDSDKVEIGDIVIAIGNPLGTELMSTVTQGIISGLDRSVTVNNLTTMSGMLQTDASINPGNSGGPLLNDRGQVIGIDTVKANADNLGFAIPINEAKIIVKNVIKNNSYRVTQFGIRGIDVRSLSSEIRDGVFIRTVIEDSIASKIGVLPGDILLKINDKNINTLGDLRKFLYTYKDGEKIKAEVLRYKDNKYTRITLK